MVVWTPGRSVWTGGLTLVALIFGPLTFGLDDLALFLVTTAVTICAGHSVGDAPAADSSQLSTPRWLEHLLVYLGTLVRHGRDRSA